MYNPLLISKANVLNINEVKPSHFAPAVTILLENYKNVVTQICKLEKLTWDNLITPLDECAAKFSIAWNTISHMNSVLSTPEVRDEYEKLLPIVTEFMASLMHNQQLFIQIKKIANSPEYNNLNSSQQHIIKLQLRDFELSGVNLDDAAKSRHTQLLAKLAQVSNKFSSNVMDVTDTWSMHLPEEQLFKLAGVPEHIIKRGRQKAQANKKDGVVLGIDVPTYIGIMSYCSDRQLRAEFYQAYASRATNINGEQLDNTKLIDEILNLRQELAHMLGFANAAQYLLAPKMAGDLSAVLEFLYSLSDKAKEPAKEQLAVLNKFAQQQGLQQELAVHDVAYYAQQYQQQMYQIDSEALRPYFPTTKVLRGMFDVAEQLYDIKLQDVTEHFKEQLWDPLVNVYGVYEHSKLIGYFYTDLYAREQKSGGAWMGHWFDRFVYGDGYVQLPIVFLCCNFTQPMDSQPGLLTHDEVETLFHEFGHGLHGLLTKVDYLGASGMAGVPWDGVELPSQFFENWAWQFPVIEKISAHYQTGQPLPRAVFDNLLQTKVYNAGLTILKQIEYSLFDLLIHANLAQNAGKSVQDILDEVRDKVAVLKPPKFNKFQNSFSHIFDGGYAAGYYSYLWADVLSCDAFSFFARDGLFNKNLGKAFKENILEKGGSADFMQLYKAYAGRAPELHHLLINYGLVDNIA
jgi:oligopeptidase A